MKLSERKYKYWPVSDNPDNKNIEFTEQKLITSGSHVTKFKPNKNGCMHSYGAVHT